MTDQSLGVCLLSCVRHQGNYAPIIHEHADLRIVCVADEPDVPEWMHDVNRDFAERYDVPYLSVEDALARSDVDLVSICSEPTRHARLAIQAADAGTHVLVDKPMATATEDAERVQAAVERTGVTLTFIHHLFRPGLQRARALIDSGRLSVPWAFHIDLITGGGLGSGFVEDFSMVVDPALSGGGEIMNFLNYAVGYLRYLTGLDVESVYTVADTYFFEPHREYDAEDLGIVALSLEKGVTATVTVGRVPAKIGSAPGSFTIRGQGTYGLFTVDLFRPRVTVEKPAGESTIGYTPPAAGSIDVEALLDDLVQAIRQGGTPRATVEDGIAIARVVDAAYRSVHSGTREGV